MLYIPPKFDMHTDEELVRVFVYLGMFCVIGMMTTPQALIVKGQSFYESSQREEVYLWAKITYLNDDLMWNLVLTCFKQPQIWTWIYIDTEIQFI